MTLTSGLALVTSGLLYRYTFIVCVCCVIEQVKSGQFRYLRPDGKTLKTFYSGKYSGLSYLSFW
jgi:hypothetical protein